MSEEAFANYSVTILVGGLILYMFFIMYKLMKDSNAGKFGGFIIFGALGLGVLGFIIKEVLIHTLDM
ncbi:hypothetical protein SIN8267_00012 [Sinobacterium norvegicum]|uniref:DUF2788 domain-containing protein n=1 Tax=Sinobacterium norvegicum TaxID=1641715 RepID=A0ABN8ECI3_9GAMM|nr:DUF2788 domain-containing protein [Sinobacterium norvegicum]CAH0989941.1 hypothetical protein SIN8267_00012 [Sinobacterium norvegicum]